MQNTSVERELLDLENRYWRAIQDNDAEAAMQLTDESCIIAGAQGIAKIEAQSLSNMLEQASYTLNGFKIQDPQVTMLSDDVAILAYKVTEDLTVDGKPVNLRASDASAWVRRDGQWRCALHTESVAGDPFGRDRHA